MTKSAAARLGSGEDQWEGVRIDLVVLSTARTAFVRPLLSTWCDKRHSLERACSGKCTRDGSQEQRGAS